MLVVKSLDGRCCMLELVINSMVLPSCGEQSISIYNGLSITDFTHSEYAGSDDPIKCRTM